MGFLSNLFGSRPKMDFGAYAAELDPEKQYGKAREMGMEWFPEFMGARERGLGQITGAPDIPELGFDIPQVDYSQFMPTTLEEALATQGFQNIWPDIERYAAGKFKGSPMSEPAVRAPMMSRLRMQTAVPIAAELAELGQRRAETSQNILLQEALNEFLGQREARTQREAGRQFDISSLLGQDPMQFMQPYAQMGLRKAETSLAHALGQQEAAMGEFGAKRQLKQQALGAVLGALGTGIPGTTGAIMGGLGKAVGGGVGGLGEGIEDIIGAILEKFKKPTGAVEKVGGRPNYEGTGVIEGVR